MTSEQDFSEFRLWSIIVVQLILWVSIWGIFDTFIKSYISRPRNQILAYVVLLPIASVAYYYINGSTFLPT